jgi:hypothetical protein
MRGTRHYRCPHSNNNTPHDLVTVQCRMAESAKIKLMLAKIGILSKPNLSEKACILAKLLSKEILGSAQDGT